MQLILHKYAKHKQNETYSKADDNTYLIVQKLLRKNVEIHENYMNVAVNFPDLLACLLEKKTDYYDKLLNKVYEDKHYDKGFCRMDFIELILTCSDEIFTKMMEKEICHDFLKSYKNDIHQKPLHIAAKLFKPWVVETVMGSEM